MRKAGVDKSVIMEITGHASEEMFHRYNTVDEDDVSRASSKFEGYMDLFTKSLPSSHQAKQEMV
jgi:hypothetical protein